MIHLHDVISIAAQAHWGQTRRDGVTPYINHPKAVAERVRGDIDAEMVAWLHDVLEDTDLTANDLLDKGVPFNVIEAVIWLTKTKGVSYETYLALIKKNPLARKVKIADMLANLSDAPSEKQIVKYAKGLLYLYE
jgi:(p)ppGpp synthase/HD superfamily hydrolase